MTDGFDLGIHGINVHARHAQSFPSTALRACGIIHEQAAITSPAARFSTSSGAEDRPQP
jgi:hypothetical protein